MNLEDRRLRRHLIVAIAAKIVILAVLWLVFFQHPRGSGLPRAAAENTAAHVLGEPASQGVSP